MIKFEFESLTGLSLTEDKYINVIEVKYMTSKLDKQQWCKQYLKGLRQDPKTVNKKELKECLKDSIENWEYTSLIELNKGNYTKRGNFISGIDMDENETYIIKYTDNSIIYFNFEYEGKKPSLLNISNIYYLNGYVQMDYYYSLIGTLDTVETFKEIGELIPTNTLIVKDMDEYYKNFELKTTLKVVA
ncbi:hypothetical protein [Clostridium estertheticum]|uniref:hypothetical protein n=1 Tax=Clostridium estertheticum TaxID=238834 RepID=UPI001C0DA676|nr:hypothetical protein [Clostridium estertheticum]MBU3173376.1 hypothetical protein [Clostridium estertheticum]